MIVSDCCGSPAYGGEDYELCPACKEHCEFVDDEDTEDDASLDLPIDKEQ